MPMGIYPRKNKKPNQFASTAVKFKCGHVNHVSKIALECIGDPNTHECPECESKAYHQQQQAQQQGYPYCHDWELMLQDSDELSKCVVEYRDKHLDDPLELATLQREIVDRCNSIIRNTFNLVNKTPRTYTGR